MPDICEIHHDATNVRHATAGLFEQQFNILHRLLGL